MVEHVSSEGSRGDDACRCSLLTLKEKLTERGFSSYMWMD